MKDWEQFQLKRVCGGPKRPVLLRAFALPDQNDIRQSRVLIMMEEVGRRTRAATDRAKELFQLTDREYLVVENLTKGWTNKEIATALGIAEQTVKEHMKHIMQKTKVTTRTGILVQVLGS